MSAAPMASNVFFQPLSLSLAYPELSKQCEKQDNWHHKQISSTIPITVRKKVKLLFTNKTYILYISCLCLYKSFNTVYI